MNASSHKQNIFANKILGLILSLLMKCVSSYNQENCSSSWTIQFASQGLKQIRFISWGSAV